MASEYDKEDALEIDRLMKESDSSSFARLLDLKIIQADQGYALASLRISEEKHLNFRGRTHGAAIFAVADHACGVCGNSLGRKAVLLNSNINMFANPEEGSLIEAEARMIHVDNIKGDMIIDIRAGNGKLVARCHCTVFFVD
jgi:acyl-CoA thioesterase